MKHLLRIAVLWAVAFAALPLEGGEGTRQSFYLADAKTILFIGDSITFGDMYVQYIDAYLFTRFPDKHFTVINRGIPSETCAGTSEPTHDPPRPDVHTRFSTTVPPLKPDVVSVCYGMNDGIYLSPNEAVFAKYRIGVERLVRRVREETKARVVVCSPPPFDFRPHAKKTPPPSLKQPDYRFPAADYDKTLAQFAAWVVTLREKGIPAVDLHTPMTRHLVARRKDDPDFILSRDGIHPGPLGHWLMAQAILLQLGAPAVVAEVQVDAKTGKSSGEVSNVETSANGVEFTWKSPLPMPIDPRWDTKSVALENIGERLNRYRLRVTHLAPGKYDLLADGEKIASVNESELSAGLDLTSYADFPTVRRSSEVLKLVQQRRRTLFEVWVKSEEHPRLTSIRKSLLKTSQATTEQAEALEKQIRQLCRPQEIAIVIRKAGS